MEVFELAIGLLVGLAISGLFPKIPLAFRSAIKQKKYYLAIEE